MTSNTFAAAHERHINHGSDGPPARGCQCGEPCDCAEIARDDAIMAQPICTNCDRLPASRRGVDDYGVALCKVCLPAWEKAEIERQEREERAVSVNELFDRLKAGIQHTTINDLREKCGLNDYQAGSRHGRVVELLRELDGIGRDVLQAVVDAAPERTGERVGEWVVLPQHAEDEEGVDLRQLASERG